MAAATAEYRKVLLSWAGMTSGQRAAVGWPDTRVELAKMLGTSDKTLQRMAGEQAFKDELAAAKAATASQLAPGLPNRPGNQAAAALSALAAAPLPEGATESEQMLAATFSQLNAMIAAGDRNAMQLFLTSPIAKSLMDQQLASSKSDFRDLSGDELAGKAAGLLSDGQLASELAARGWTCLPPAELAEPAGAGE